MLHNTTTPNDDGYEIATVERNATGGCRSRTGVSYVERQCLSTELWIFPWHDGVKCYIYSCLLTAEVARDYK